MDIRASKRPIAMAVVLVMVVVAGVPATLDAQETRHEPAKEHAVPAGGAHEAAEQHAEGHGEHFHKNHLSLFVGSTEAEEHHGEKGDPDFTLGLDYERRLNTLFGLGAMVDWVAEGNREYLVGPIGFLHPYKGAKLYAAPCYQHVRESGDENFVLRVGASWDFELGDSTVGPHVIYDLADEQDFLVLGIGFGRGF